MNNLIVAKPFLKWAGGKTQIIPYIQQVFPNFEDKEFTYIEPFVGSGAVLFWVLNNFPSLKKAVINDINGDLINTYKIIAAQPHKLIDHLLKLQTNFHSLADDEKKAFYYNIRALFNTRNSDPIYQAALFIFLNRTCFNGLYRVNKRNEFNVPMGSYKKPLICDAHNILAVSHALDKVTILNGDFEHTMDYADTNTLFYFDPPYRPLNATSNFTSYAKESFNDDAQIRLGEFCKKIDAEGHQWILSNSDPKVSQPDDDFFDDLYSEYRIHRIEASRQINADASKRGKLTELLITNIL